MEPAAATQPAEAREGHPPRRLARAWRWWAARPVLSAAAIYAVVSVAFVGQGLLPGRTLSPSDMLWSTAPWTAEAPPEVRWGGANFELADSVTVFHPFFQYTRDALPDIPLWNPHVMGGRPFMANAQSAIFSPFTWPAYVLPFWTSLAVIAILKLFTGAFGTFLLGRALGMRFGGSLLAGLVFAFGTFFVVWLAWPLTNVFPLLPWLLLVSELLVRRPGALVGAGLAALVGLTLLGGHPETSFHVLVAVTVFFAFRVLVRWSRGGRERALLVRPAVAYIVAMAGGAAMAAVMLVPLFEFFLNSGDYERRLESEPGHALAKYLGAMFLFDYWGRPTQTSLVPDLVSNRGFYAGGITLMLAAAALLLRPTVMRVAFAIFGAIVLAVVLGAEPIFSIVTALPGFRTAHNGRMVILFLFVLAMLAGWGLDELTRGEQPRPRRAATLAAGALIFCGPVVWLIASGNIAPDRFGAALEVAWGFADPPAPAPPGPGDDGVLRAVAEPVPESTVEIVRLSALLQWLPLAGAGLAILVLRLGVPASRARLALPVAAAVALAVVLLVTDLFRANMGFNPAIPVDHAEQPRTGALRYLQSRSPNRFAGLNRPGIGQPLQPDLAMRYDLYDARGYDYPVEQRYDAFWRATAAPAGDLVPPTGRAEPTVRSLRALSLLSVTDVIQDPSDPPSRLPGLRVAYSGPDARIYRNVRAVPRAFLVGGQRPVDGEDAALAATIAPGFDARRVAITEEPVPGLPRRAAAPTGTARVTRYDREDVTVAVSARARSLLVLTDVHYPGWKATVDGRPAEIERVDYLLRGLVVPRGTHRVEFRYEPASWRIGWIVSVLAVLTVLAVALAAAARRRSPRARGPAR